MKLIYTDILRWCVQCWKEAFFAGILFMMAGRLINKKLNHERFWGVLYFADGFYIYYLFYVTLLMRSIGSRREVEFMPFTNSELMNGDFHYLIENILLFIPFGFLMYATLRAYGRECGIGMILLIAFLISVSVELLQYVFSCGKSETDDVITNVLGALIGYMIIKISGLSKGLIK